MYVLVQYRYSKVHFIVTLIAYHDQSQTVLESVLCVCVGITILPICLKLSNQPPPAQQLAITDKFTQGCVCVWRCLWVGRSLKREYKMTKSPSKNNPISKNNSMQQLIYSSSHPKLTGTRVECCNILSVGLKED